MNLLKKIKNMDIFSKLFVILLVSFGISLFLSWGQGFGPDEGNHSMLGLFYLDSLEWWIKGPTFDLNSIFTFGINYLIYYPVLAVYYPPAFHLLLSTSFFIFSPSFVAGKLVSLVSSLLTLIVTFKLGEIIWNKKIGFLGTLFLSTSFLFFKVGGTVRLDMLFLLFSMLSLYFYYKTKKTEKWNNYLFGGIFLSLSFLTKWLSIALFPIILFFAKLKNKNNLKKFLSSIILAILIISPWAIIAYEANFLLIPIKSTVAGKDIIASEPMPFTASGILFYPLKFITTQVSPVFAFFALVSIIFYFTRGKREEKLMMLIWIFSVFVLAWLIPNKGWRYTILFLPAFTFISAWTIDKISRNFKKISILIISVLLVSQIGFTWMNLDPHKKEPQDSVVNYILNNTEGPIIINLFGKEIPQGGFTFKVAKNKKMQIFRGCVISKKNQSETEEFLVNKNIQYAVVKESEESARKSRITKMIKNSSNMVEIRNFDENYSIYRNKKYDPSGKKLNKCNYVCAIDRWICKNTTLENFYWQFKNKTFS